MIRSSGQVMLSFLFPSTGSTALFFLVLPCFYACTFLYLARMFFIWHACSYIWHALHNTASWTTSPQVADAKHSKYSAFDLHLLLFSSCLFLFLLLSNFLFFLLLFLLSFHVFFFGILLSIKDLAIPLCSVFWFFTSFLHFILHSSPLPGLSVFSLVLSFSCFLHLLYLIQIYKLLRWILFYDSNSVNKAWKAIWPFP